MGLLDKFSGADIAAIITGTMGMLAIVIGAYWQHRKGDDEADEPPPRPRRSFVIELGEESRRAISRMTDAMHDHGRRVGDAIGDHRDAIEDQTKALKQKE